MITFDEELTTPLRTLLLVEDDRLILSTLSSGLIREGFKVCSVESVNEAEQWLENNERPDLVILDVRMPDRDGLELIKRLDELNHIPFMMLTAYGEKDIMQKAIESGAIGYMVKPVDIMQLVPAIETALTRAEEISNLRNAKQQLQTALDSDRAVSIAVGIVMDQHQINHNEALQLLRNTARSRHMKLIELASSIVNSREILNLKISA
jgi:response regulator NasT